MAQQTIPHNWHWYHPDYAACVNCNQTRNTISKDEACKTVPAPTTPDTTLSELMLAAEYADQMAAIHRPRCRARGRMEDCARCEGLEDAVVRTDQALRHYWASLSQGAA